jgi:hypothetical protein
MTLVQTMIRFVTLLALLSGLAWWLDGQQARGRFQKMDRGFLELMLANARDRFIPQPGFENPVLFLPLKEAEKNEYAAWPPLPVDYQMILKGALQKHTEVVVITDALRWPAPKPPMIQELADLLLPLTAVVVTSSTLAEADVVAESLFKDRLGTVSVTGSPDTLPQALRAGVPESSFIRQSEVAIAPENRSPALLANDQGQARATPALMALLRAVKVPLSEVRATIGGGSALYLGDEHFLPLQDDGTLSGAADFPLLEHNALEVMTAGMLEDQSGDLGSKLATAKHLVLGIDSESETLARGQARALAYALALPKVTMLSRSGQWITWALAALLGLSLLTLEKSRALNRALLYLLLALVGSFLTFQMQLVWFPPAVPAALVLAAGVFIRLFGRKTSTPTTPHG